MLARDQESGVPERESQNWEPVRDRELRLRRESKAIVTVEECGKIIGKIISPVQGDIFGPWHGAVYLTRD